MKNKILILCLLLLTVKGLLSAQPSQIAIEVNGAGYAKKTFSNNELLWSNRNYTIQDLPTDFIGFEFLQSAATVAEGGTITPLADGLVYLIGKESEINNLGVGWSVVPNTMFDYNNNGTLTELVIFQHIATANTPINIPLAGGFTGATPIAKTINYNSGLSNLSVRGDLIDILDANGGSEVFPQNTTFDFPGTLPGLVAGKKYAVSLVEYNGVTQVSSENAVEIVVATHYNSVTLPGWTYTGQSFAISSQRNYYIYTYQYTTPNQWINIPQPLSTGTTAPTLVFADNIIWSNPLPLPGIEITKTLDLKDVNITNPSMTILPDGDYLAACTGALRFSGQASGVSFFLSKDKGLTWQVQSANNGLMSYQNLFVHNGELYVMGTNAPTGDIIIRKSTDKGITWTYPTASGQDGWLRAGSFHSAPVPLVVHNGRIWRGFEFYNGGQQQVFVMSAPVDSDLMKAANWTYTNALSSQSNWVVGKNIIRWIEGNVVVDRNGNVVNILKLDERSEGGIAAISTVTDVNTLTFNPATDIIDFPGGCKKFVIRYDALSDKYWAISNAVFEEDRSKTHAGIYKNGVSSDLLRNRSVLMYSDDLRNWIIKDTLMSSENPFFHGFQYADFQFDGNDLAIVYRTGYEEERGLPTRQHDANFFTFLKFENFRDGLLSTKDNRLKESDVKIGTINNEIRIYSNTLNTFDIFIYDMTGKKIYSKIKTENKTISSGNFQSGIYIIKIKSDEKIYTKKLIID
jgi:hypothetical protein